MGVHCGTARRLQVILDFNNSDRLNPHTRRLTLQVAGQELRASAPQIGRLHQFIRYRMAERVSLPPGRHMLTIKPYLLGPGVLMNLRAVVLDRMSP